MSPTYSNESGRILLIDNALSSLVRHANVLRQSGYEIYQASDSHRAIQIAADVAPLLILLDVSAADMSGYEIFSRLKAADKTAAIPVVFLGASEKSAEKMRSFRQGAADYIAQSSGSDELLARVQYQMARQLSQLRQQQQTAELESRIQERTHLLALAHDQLLEESLNDRLTRLPNRLSFVKRLSKVMARSRRHFAVLFLDCDRFKRINDSLGHRMGDQLLKAIARRLVEIKRSHGCIDCVARFGGDEFALLLTSLTNRATADEVAQEIIRALARPFSLAGREIFMNASIGMVWGDATYTASEHVLRDADVAMYRAKASNRSQHYWFEPAMHHQALNLLQLETDLHLALARREFELYYQPIVALDCLKIMGFEALVRWHHPTRGLLLPGAFIRFAEESNLIIALGEQVLEMACADIARWAAAGSIDADLTVSVNIAAQQLVQPNILERIDSIVQRFGIEPHRLRLELTERSILNSHAFVDNVLRGLQQRNIRLSIDDFGIGYSALSYLHRLPVNCLKVDRSFVAPITDGPDSLGIVPLIVNIAKTMKMQVVAEGIETAVQLRQLQLLGCGYGQGFLFERAVPAERAIALLKEPVDLSMTHCLFNA